MRRLLAILLCVAILLPCVGVNAKEDYTFYKINIDAGSGTIGEKAIVQDGEIYISADSFTNYTRFSFDEKTKTFLIRGQELKKAFKSVVIDIYKKRMLISGKKFFNLSDCFEIDGEIYLPLCQMLPILNADIYEVKDNIIYISNNKLSLAEVLYDFDISDYYFNISTEFYDMDWAALLTIVPNYVWDTVVNVRFDRLDIVYNSGEYNDYKDAFSDFLSDDNLYLTAMAENASAIDSTVEFFNKANSTAKDMKSVYGWVEAAGKSEISSETGGALLDSLKAYYDSGDLKTDDLKGLNDAWTGGKISFGDCIEILTYVYTYATQVEDNRQMLNAVYNVDSKISKKETARKAAKQVYDLYGDNIVPAIYKEIATTVASDALEDLSPIGIYTATAKVAGTVLETFMPFEPGEIAKLPVYSDVVLSASSKYRSYDTLTDDSTENLRLSLLLCLIASKKCFEVMGDVFDEDTSYYKNKIEKIEQLIMGLYIAEENTDFDSFEHFEEYKNANLKKIEKSKMFDSLEQSIINENSVFIPADLEMINDDIIPNSNYRPRIHFYNNMKCELIFNLSEGMSSYQAPFEIKLCDDDKKIIKIDISEIEIVDFKKHVTPYIYLFEKNSTTWEYYGESIGYTRAGDAYNTLNDKTILINNTSTLPTFTKICGVYSGERLDDLTIRNVVNNQLTFSVEWVRRGNIDISNAIIYGNLIPFKYYNNYSDVHTAGVLEITETTAIITLLESGIPDVNIGAYTYEYFGSEEDAATSYNKMVLLDLQSESRGWSRTIDTSSIHGIIKDMYIRFNSDGSMIYWYGKPLAGETIYTKHLGNYKITKDRLYINGCAYSLYAYTAGSTTMTLKALGNYEIDFSGEYFCENDEMFQFLYADN